MTYLIAGVIVPLVAIGALGLAACVVSSERSQVEERRPKGWYER